MIYQNLFSEIEIKLRLFKEEVKYDQRYFIDSQEDYDNITKTQKIHLRLLKEQSIQSSQKLKWNSWSLSYIIVMIN